MAPGVGKTYAALQECHRRKARGTDVVVGFVEHYDRPQTVAQIGDLEVLPRKQIPYGGTTVEEMDTDAVVARRPRVVLVDELAHTNAPARPAGSTPPGPSATPLGTSREKRWQ